MKLLVRFSLIAFSIIIVFFLVNYAFSITRTADELERALIPISLFALIVTVILGTMRTR